MLEAHDSGLAAPLTSQGLQAALTEAEQIKESLVDNGIDWFGDHMGAPFYAFRSIGIITIVLSVSLPVFALVDFRGSRIVTAVMSASIAGLSSLGAFFHWERTWRSRTMALDSIEYLVAKWKLELSRAKTLEKESDRIALVYAATDDLLKNYRAILGTEAESFFSGLQMPQSDRAAASKEEK